MFEHLQFLSLLHLQMKTVLWGLKLQTKRVSGPWGEIAKAAVSKVKNELPGSSVSSYGITKVRLIFCAD